MADPVDPDAVTGPAVAKMTSKYMLNAERYLKERGCNVALATMVVRAPTYETFSIRCSSGTSSSVRCENGSCQAIQ